MFLNNAYSKNDKEFLNSFVNPPDAKILLVRSDDFIPKPIQETNKKNWKKVFDKITSILSQDHLDDKTRVNELLNLDIVRYDPIAELLARRFSGFF
jgi:hypothetical protein